MFQRNADTLEVPAPPRRRSLNAPRLPPPVVGQEVRELLGEPCEVEELEPSITRDWTLVCRHVEDCTICSTPVHRRNRQLAGHRLMRSRSAARGATVRMVLLIDDPPHRRRRCPRSVLVLGVAVEHVLDGGAGDPSRAHRSSRRSRHRPSVVVQVDRGVAHTRWLPEGGVANRRRNDLESAAIGLRWSAPEIEPACARLFAVELSDDDDRGTAGDEAATNASPPIHVTNAVTTTAGGDPHDDELPASHATVNHSARWSNGDSEPRWRSWRRRR